eukprot:CAMPEP_0182568338 /NCGR_PEP_ID=MMETSP1324-20130603/9316_1 /TAXON_ID=236786 /ORGANISM="Florenciella sp., Strain RCC1587" /LENGTH=97 /DNA_ID=CAMNT_0024782469 /DNA_START=106 /DNA_END=396 /DNA_ORIENTATION=-
MASNRERVRSRSPREGGVKTRVFRQGGRVEWRRTDEQGNVQSGLYPKLEDEGARGRKRAKAPAKPKGIIAGGLAENGLSPSKMPNFGPVLEGRKRGS